MGTVHQKTCNVLNDLIKINHDRLERYTRAHSESKEGNAAELGSSLQKMIEQSRNYIAGLSNLFTKYGGAGDGTITMGRIHRTWNDLQITFSAHDRKNILDVCEFGEDAAQRVYKMALEEYELGEEARSLIAKQKNSLLDSHDLIKSYCNRKKVHE